MRNKALLIPILLIVVFVISGVLFFFKNGNVSLIRQLVGGDLPATVSISKYTFDVNNTDPNYNILVNDYQHLENSLATLAPVLDKMGVSKINVIITPMLSLDGAGYYWRTPEGQRLQYASVAYTKNNDELNLYLHINKELVEEHGWSLGIQIDNFELLTYEGIFIAYTSIVRSAPGDGPIISDTKQEALKIMEQTEDTSLYLNYK
jgi:hypothetical protein